ncbi:MAG: hypothetical protein PHE43_02150 [Candidatus Nanoarchaeia archaeon]|nr:hypothetical protein [Candidatus Nanoarchaeia archaeon]
MKEDTKIYSLFNNKILRFDASTDNKSVSFQIGNLNGQHYILVKYLKNGKDTIEKIFFDENLKRKSSKSLVDILKDNFDGSSGEILNRDFYQALCIHYPLNDKPEERDKYFNIIKN